MRQEVARILNLVVAMLVIAALWGVATMRQTDTRDGPNPRAIHPIQNENPNA
ncbi:hypothetical protein [Brevundimonas sp.]|jgi:hypothetical protein|uniref:hypothetical protein n=1 Tax=Brevundimonas sp. TaxID=1871086 RepID=UPI0037C18652